MLRLKSRSIRAKLVTIIGLITLTTLGVVLVVVIISDIRAFKRETLDSAQLVAQVIGSGVQNLDPDHDPDHDPSPVQRILSSLVEVPAIELACLYDNAGQPISHAGDASRLPVLPPDSSRTRAELDGELLHVLQPVVSHGETVGVLYVGATTGKLWSEILGHVLIMVAVAVVLVALSLLVTLRLQRIISEPILQLAETTRRISETGDHTVRFTSSSTDQEIAVLCDGFNEMLDQLHLRQLERDAAELRTREKSQFLAAMSHELRTPLNSIIGFSEILLAKAGDRLLPKQMKFLANIHKSGRMLLGIINDILDLSKVEAGRMDFCPEPVSIPDILAGVITVMKGTAQKSQIEIRMEIGSDIPRIEADPIKIKQVFFNLLSNAVKFSPEQSIVRVTAVAMPPEVSPLGRSSVMVSVIDRGVGIAGEDRQKIFQPFRQADSGIGRRFGGTGLGLALVHAFVSRHGGKILLDSTVGVGSTFSVVLPQLFRGTGIGTPETTILDYSPALSILLVETLAETVEQVRRTLIGNHYELVVAANAQQAVDLVRRFPPALILVDTEMPNVSSWDVLQTVKMHRKTIGIPVVLFSVDSEHQPVVCLAADDYFMKPLGIEKLVRRISEIVPRERLERPSVLVIDDDTMVHDLLEARLVPAGYQVDHAFSSEEGLALAEKNVPQLIILSLLLEKTDGFQVAMRLRTGASTAATPLVVTNVPDLSAESRDWLQRKVSALAEDGGVATPALSDAISELLVRRAEQATEMP